MGDIALAIGRVAIPIVFIVPEEEDEDDVTDIIGEGIENDEET